VLTHPGCHLGDSWYFVDGDVVHCYYLVCPDSVPRHTAWDIAHATSTDLVDWTLHGIVVRRGAADAWDGNCLATGSVVLFDDRYVMAYTARWNEVGVATGIATSDDLCTWTKQGVAPATVPAAPYVCDRPWTDRPPTHWRDPFLRVKTNGDDPPTLVQLVAAARGDRPDDISGAVGVARSADGLAWTLDAPLDVEGVSRELECPQVCEVDGSWFLIFSAFPALFGDSVRADPAARLGHGTYAMAGDGPNGPFRFVQRRPILPAEHPTQSYAGQVITWRGTSYLLGTVWSDNGDCLADAVALRADGRLLVAAS
jgi:beta-fructofuranosidase